MVAVAVLIVIAIAGIVLAGLRSKTPLPASRQPPMQRRRALRR